MAGPCVHCTVNNVGLGNEYPEVFLKMPIEVS